MSDSEEAPRLGPGTYDLTKRVEVDENGVARFVDTDVITAARAARAHVVSPGE